MKNRKLYPELLQTVLYTAIVFYFISCASSDDDRYNFITEKEKKTIEEFCKCTEPIQPLMERLTNSLQDSTQLDNFMNDTNYMKQLTDSLDFMLSNLAPCFEKAKAVFESGNMGKEKEEQFLKYFKNNYPKCLPLVLGERRMDSVKTK